MEKTKRVVWQERDEKWKDTFLHYTVYRPKGVEAEVVFRVNTREIVQLSQCLLEEQRC